jgi:capsular exopolysaccharide synthesis family protein
MHMETIRETTDALEPLQTSSYPDLLGVALRRKSLIALGIVGGLVLGSFYYAQSTPVYRSDARVLVIKKRPDALPIAGVDPGMSYFEDYLSTHQAIIKSPLIVGRAVKKHELQAMKSFGGIADPTDAILLSLSVSRDYNKEAGSSNNVLNLAFRGRVAAESGVVLNAVIDSYKDFLDETYRNVSDDTLELIKKARDVLQKDLAQKEMDYRDFRQRSPLLWKSKDGTTLYQERLGSIESKKSALLVRKAEIQGRLSALEGTLKDSLNRAALVTTLPETNRRTSALTLEEQLLPLLLQEETLSQNYGPDHPQLLDVRLRIQRTREFFADLTGTPGGSPKGPGEGGDRPRAPNQVELYVLSLKQELLDIEASERLLAAMFQREYDEARKLNNYEAQDEAFRHDLTRTQQLYNSIISRLQEVNIVRDFGGYSSRIIAPAGTGTRIEPKAFPIFTAAALLGILGGFGLAYLAEKSDKSFRSPEEIRRRLGLPIVGHIPLIPVDEPVAAGTADEGGRLDPVLFAHYRSQSREAESYRGVRTSLYFSMHGKAHKVVQITSPNVADGKTTLAANLGISIAQSGKTIILVDADFRRPRLHTLFGLSATAGLASVIAGEGELEDAIQESGIPGLSVLPCGPLPPNPAELLTTPRFKELLDVIRERYDFVLVDTPPLLAVTDPCVVAPRVDGVLLNIRASKDGRPSAIRAKEILNTLGVTVLGVVVNGVDGDGKSGGYGYDYYSYSYRNGYYRSDDGYYSGNATRENGHEQAGAASGGTAQNGSSDAAALGHKRPRKKARHGFFQRIFRAK